MNSEQNNIIFIHPESGNIIMMLQTIFELTGVLTVGDELETHRLGQLGRLLTVRHLLSKGDES